MSDQQWKVVTAPEGDNGEKTPEKNHGGIVIFLQQGQHGQRQEFSRVAFVRRNGRNPKTSFKAQCRREKARAQEACDVLNEAFESAGTLA